MLLFSFQGPNPSPYECVRHGKKEIYSLKTERTVLNVHNRKIAFRRVSTRDLMLTSYPYKGGDPAAPSDTATVLRLHPRHCSHLRPLARTKRVTSPTAGVTDSRGVTGGVYKARERIHRGMLIRDY